MNDDPWKVKEKRKNKEKNTYEWQSKNESDKEKVLVKITDISSYAIFKVVLILIFMMTVASLILIPLFQGFVGAF